MIGLYVGTSVVKCLKFQEAILINNHAIKENYTLGNPPNILIYIILYNNNNNNSGLSY